MTTYEIGQTVTVGIKVYDSTGTLANLGGGNPTCTVTKPDGSTTAATVTTTGTGLYQGSLTGTLFGRYRFTFTGSGTNSGGTPWTDVADVFPADPRFIISLSDVKSGLNMPSTVSVNDDELRLYIAAATMVIENIAGPVLQATLVEKYDGGRTSINLRHVPIAGVTTITEWGVTLSSANDYIVNTKSGVVTRVIGINDFPFRYGTQQIVITYTVGGSSLNPNVLLAARELVRYWWQWGQQGQAGRGRSPGTNDVVAAGYAVPNRVMELLSPETAIPGIA